MVWRARVAGQEVTDLERSFFDLQLVLIAREGSCIHTSNARKL